MAVPRLKNIESSPLKLIRPILYIFIGSFILFCVLCSSRISPTEAEYALKVNGYTEVKEVKSYSLSGRIYMAKNPYGFVVKVVVKESDLGYQIILR